MKRCPKCATLLGDSFKPCPICGFKQTNPLLKLNPKPSMVPTEKHKHANYCPVCDMTIVRPTPLDTCPYCGTNLHRVIS